MPTTTLTDSTFAVATIGARTDAAGAVVADLSAEESRLPIQIFTAGRLGPAASFVVQAQASPNMTVKVGSGTAKSDYYIVAGTVAGQGNYMTRLDVTSQNIAIGAADASQTRTDEIYLVVSDNAYDSSLRALPRLGYRKGDLGGANPGPDAAWKASVLLARIAVAPATSTIVNGNITDLRTNAALISSLTTGSIVRFPPVTLTDAPTVATNAALGDYFRLTAAGNRTLAAPTNPTDGQAVTWEILASSVDRTITLATGSTGAFLYGVDITALSVTPAGKRDLIRAIYNGVIQRWLIVGYVRAF